MIRHGAAVALRRAAGTAIPPRLAVPAALDPAMLRHHDPQAVVTTLAGLTMGTGWRVQFAAPATPAASSVRVAIQARLDAIEAEMSHWSQASLLARFHRAAPGSSIALPPDFATVITGALAIAAASGGAFDPAFGRVTDLWGLGPNRRAAPPSPAALAEARAASGWERLDYDPAARRLCQPGGLWLDLSGIAKGHAADAVASVLAAHDVHHALIEIGGECVGRGMRPDGDPWWVDLEAPPGLPLAPLRVALHGLAVATSGDYVRGAHTLDPRTGLPAGEAPSAVSVIDARCMIADAWATALTVLAPAEAHAHAETEGLAVRIVARDGTEWLSPALVAMLA